MAEPQVLPTGEAVDTTLNANVNTIKTDVTIIEDHLHPVISRVNPSARFRRGGITFSATPVGGTLTLGLAGAGVGQVIYTIVAVLGVPAANNVQVLNQGTLDLNVRKLAQAIQGVTDAVNIAYGAPTGNTKPNPTVYGYYTSQRFNVGTVAHVAGSSIMTKEKVGDQTVALTIALGGGMVATTTTQYTRVYSHRYSMAAIPLLNDRIAGPFQTFVAMGSVIDSATGVPVRYDIDSFISEAVSQSNSIIEVDAYFSMDEITFVLMSYGNNVSKDAAVNGAQQVLQRSERVPAGGGLYLRLREDVSSAETIDMKVQFHQYPVGV
jgi:hypothetical protein